MSDVLDYWPFDYTCYIEEILPALHFALEGHTTHLQQLASLGQQQNLSFGSPSARSRGIFDDKSPSTEEFFALLAKDRWLALDTPRFSWPTVERLASFLPGHHFGEIFDLGAELHLALIYAFCSASMPGGIGRWQPPIGGGEDESIWRWREYFERDESWRDLWEPFYNPPPDAITMYISAPYDSAYPRGLNPFGEASDKVTLNGFLTPDETRRLAKELPLRRNPFFTLTSYDFVREYVMREWETQMALRIPDYQERKYRYYQAHKQLSWHGTISYDPHIQAEREKEEKILKERFFGKELGARLLYIERNFSDLRLGYAGQEVPEEDRFFQPPEPEREEERFFLIPKEVYYDVDTETMLPQWVQACPEEAVKVHRLDWDSVWLSEDELMRRLEYAVSRQWGMLMYYRSGK